MAQPLHALLHSVLAILCGLIWFVTTRSLLLGSIEAIGEDGKEQINNHEGADDDRQILEEERPVPVRAIAQVVHGVGPPFHRDGLEDSGNRLDNVVEAVGAEVGVVGERAEGVRNGATAT
eukprot:scaffold68796_cov32-Tisochrysis_lutea.AAC.4